jgi:uncharacterized protein with PQ loop repeat
VLLATSGFVLTLSFIAPTLSVLQCVAQALRFRTSGAQGVSLDTWILSAFVTELWTGYGLIYHVPAEIYANIPFLIVAGIVVAVAARRQHAVRRAVVGALIITIITLLVSLAGLSPHWRWILATLSDVSAVTMYLPQMVVALRSSNLEGVSVVSWALATLTGLAWALYGVLIHQPPVALPSVVMVPSALVILIQVSRHRLRGRALRGVLAPIVE